MMDSKMKPLLALTQCFETIQIVLCASVFQLRLLVFKYGNITHCVLILYQNAQRVSNILTKCRG